jgi:hypothetical protein
MLTVALFIIAPQKSRNNPNVHERIMNTMRSSPTLEYYSAIKKNEAVTLAATPKTPEDLMLSERSCTQRSPFARLVSMSCSEQKNLTTERQEISRQLEEKEG